jgi:hypothetical protein
MRWDPYFMKNAEEFKVFWRDYLQTQNRNIIYVLGKGFDSRMCSGLSEIIKLGGKGTRDCLLIEFDEGKDSPSMPYKSRVSDNYIFIEKLMKDKGNIISKTVKMWINDGNSSRRVTSRNSANIFSNISDFKDYTDIIIDVSSVPRSIYFPLIGKILYLLDHSDVKQELNVHVVVSEDSNKDKKYRAVGIDDSASYVHGFSGDLDREATLEKPIVWIPVLGENHGLQLEKIYNLIKSTNSLEICPVLPSPSKNPRRSDDLLIEYRELFFDKWHIDPNNIIFAHEQNPFDVYRQILSTVLRYNRALKPLNGCKCVVSAESSKLLSLGALLSVYELTELNESISLAHVEAKGYEIIRPEEEAGVSNTKELFSIWLAGNCYK